MAAKPTPPPFVHPEEKATEAAQKPVLPWTPVPTPPPSSKTEHGEKKMSLWAKLKNWGK